MDVQRLGPRAFRVRSRSEEGRFYAVDLDDRGGRGSCSCKGFEYRKHCAHIDGAMNSLLGRTPEGLPAVCPDLFTSFLDSTKWRDSGLHPVGVCLATEREGVKVMPEIAAVHSTYEALGVEHFRERFARISAANEGRNIVLLGITPNRFECVRGAFGAWWFQQTRREVVEL